MTAVHHPNTAVKSENAPTQAQVEKAEELAKSAANDENAAGEKSGLAQGEYETAKKSVIGSIKDLGLNCELENAKETAAAELQNIEITLADIVKELNLELNNTSAAKSLRRSFRSKLKSSTG